MALVLRSEKGSPLTPDEVDGNFSFLKGLVDSFTAPAGVSVQNISVSGNQMTIHLTDGTTRGPFELPIAAPQWQPAYEPGTLLHTLDIFSIEADGVYMVLFDHTAPDPFDPLLNDAGQPAYQKLFGFQITPNTTLTILHEVSGDHALVSADSGKYIRMEAPGPADVVISFDEIDPLPEGFTCVIRGAGVGPFGVRFEDVPTGLAGTTDTPVGIINVPDSLTAMLRGVGSSATLTKVGVNEWDLAGDLASV